MLSNSHTYHTRGVASKAGHWMLGGERGPESHSMVQTASGQHLQPVTVGKAADSLPRGAQLVTHTGVHRDGEYHLDSEDILLAMGLDMLNEQ